MSVVAIWDNALLTDLIFDFVNFSFKTSLMFSTKAFASYYF